MEELPSDIKTFIKSNIQNADQLRVLLLLEASPDRDWDPLAVCAALHITPDAAREALAHLAERGLLGVGRDGEAHRWQPNTPELSAAANCLVEIERVRPVSVISYVYEAPRDIRAFADAFRLRKEG